MNDSNSPVVTVESVTHHYKKTCALNDVSVRLSPGQMVGLIGPDGVGKSTLMGLISGAKIIQKGKIHVLGGDIGNRRHRQDVCPQIAYMPQGLGKNLYSELSVFENLDFFGRLFAQPSDERRYRIENLLKATGLDPFPDRPAGKLSGGMKQKLGLCCALIHDPDLLLLDEPTTGVDPLSRRQFWKLIEDIRNSRPEMSVLVSTAYMEEADQFERLIAMHNGQILSTGSPQELREQANTDTLEEAFVQLLPTEARGDGHRLEIPPRKTTNETVAIEATGLTRRFGKFVAVNNVSFKINQGEIFGFLGSNGCGKTTTMKMLTGLLPASEGHAELFGKPIKAGSLKMRKRVGYMSQSFSLYSELTVSQNLWLHARLFHLPKTKQKKRIDELVSQFELSEYMDQLASQLPLGVRQRLSLAVAVIHEPELLILDEPTSGVDPVARDSFWELLVKLSREHLVTIFISTHFMNEAMRCDRISLMHAGNVLAYDEPTELVRAQNTSSLEDAFIEYITQANEANTVDYTGKETQSESDLTHPVTNALDHKVPQYNERSFFSIRRMLAFSYREGLEIRRDSVRLAFAFIGSIVFMFVLGYGISTDVNEVRFAILDQDQSPESTAYIQALVGSGYFVEQSPIHGKDDIERQLKENRITLGIEIPPSFGLDLKRSSQPEVSAWIDGADPSRASTIEGYVEGVHATYLNEHATETGRSELTTIPFRIEQRFRYNPTFESIYAIVPSVPPMLLMLIPAILMAVSVVKEKELGSITNFYVTPTSKLEFLVGKQLPYVIIGMISFFLLTLMSYVVFHVPIKGSPLTLMVCAFVYIITTTGIGLVISSFTTSQVAAVFVTTIITMTPTVQFSGLMQPVSTLEGAARTMGLLWPTTYYMHASVGAFTKGLGLSELSGNLLVLLIFIPVLTLLATISLKKQER
ncbi:ribosome-associated ATPase/putative transporter RbbA [Gimesia aquarii]|uniref:Putative ABC transporter ATP-binding protein YbhF n=1 Tax=Gimesia aquarii TaxID=2527964 RepID=A0A517VPB3_9PLAN|nr:ribosome-associated ATPase/putative transporter RbbA [Gimesia aquarii]QDT94856.1 putative ABC transporter ATP-binding protein YbhF [Gimesia aquarii]